MIVKRCGSTIQLDYASEETALSLQVYRQVFAFDELLFFHGGAHWEIGTGLIPR